MLFSDRTKHTLPTEQSTAVRSSMLLDASCGLAKGTVVEPKAAALESQR